MMSNRPRMIPRPPTPRAAALCSLSSLQDPASLTHARAAHTLVSNTLPLFPAHPALLDITHSPDQCVFLWQLGHKQGHTHTAPPLAFAFPVAPSKRGTASISWPPLTLNPSTIKTRVPPVAENPHMVNDASTLLQSAHHCLHAPPLHRRRLPAIWT